MFIFFFFFNDTATTEIYTLSLHDALPIVAAARATCTMLLVATMVTSVPARLMSATPKGTVYSSAGTGPLTRYIILSSKMTTGLSSRMAVFISPLASYGVDGRATLRPGMWLTQACGGCECWGAD